METPIWHQLTSTETIERLQSSKDGLTEAEVLHRQKTSGFNILPREKMDGWWMVFGRQFMSPLMVILVIAAVVSVALDDWVDAGVIVAAVFVNTIIGFIQEYKANRALEHLRELVQPQAMVLRGGKQLMVASTQIVPGDILVLHAGDRVMADTRLLNSVNLMTNEAALTGESLPILKDSLPLEPGVALAERRNMVFAGTSVVGGRGLALVVATGAHTELGKIAELVRMTPERQTPLQQQLADLARWMAAVVVALVVILFTVGVFSGRAFIEMFEMSVALAVAAVPEGLIVSVTIILAIGMQRILRRKSLVRRLVGAETLGSVSVICSDKTGTITEGEMRVTHLVTLKQTWVSPFPSGEKADHAMRRMFEVMILCNDASVVRAQDGFQMSGTPTERALLSAALEFGVGVEDLREQHPRVAEIPFDSVSKFMATAHTRGSKTDIFVKGAPSVVLSFCRSIQVDGRAREMTDQDRTTLTTLELDLTRQGIRLLALALTTKEARKTALSQDDLSGCAFLGFVGLQDPLRKEVPAQIEAARRAGVRTVLITGDHPETARAIATEAGLASDPGSVAVGVDLDGWSDEELEKRVSRISVYARVEPRHKLRIVRAWQARGEVVAMTGDGVNDAPALKAADIGVAVGSGTEVAKQASDLVILDNDLGTITAAIEEGRVIFDNIRKTTVYLLADSFTEMILIGGSILLGLPVPLLPAQILWINLIADSFPAVGLTREPAEADVMLIPPRPRSESVLTKEMLTIIFIIGAVTDLVLFGLYLWLFDTIGDMHVIRSIMFAAVGIDSLLYIFAVKSLRRTIFHINPFSNPWLIFGVGVGFALMLLALVHPFFQEIFEVAPLTLSGWGLLLMIGLVKLLAIELTKEVLVLKRRMIGSHEASHL